MHCRLGAKPSYLLGSPDHLVLRAGYDSCSQNSASTKAQEGSGTPSVKNYLLVSALYDSQDFREDFERVNVYFFLSH